MFYLTIKNFMYFLQEFSFFKEKKAVFFLVKKIAFFSFFYDFFSIFFGFFDFFDFLLKKGKKFSFF